jgi:hypothetical protein
MRVSGKDIDVKTVIVLGLVTILGRLIRMLAMLPFIVLVRTANDALRCSNRLDPSRPDWVEWRAHSTRAPIGPFAAACAALCRRERAIAPA